MKRTVALIVLCLIGVGALAAQTRHHAPARAVFGTVEVWADSGGEPIAAWQVRLRAQRAGVKIVGIEGGAHEAYAQPPYYDTRAMQNDHVILAALSTADDLPVGKTRIASVHYMSETGAPPRFEAQFIAAANTDAQRITLAITTTTHHTEGIEP